jgi:hypothetical protein
MSYNVTVRGPSVNVVANVNSYDAAKNAIKSCAAVASVALSAPVRPGLFRSFKATRRVNEDRQRSAAKLATGVKLPKTAGDVSGKVGGLSYAIVRK